MKRIICLSMCLILAVSCAISVGAANTDIAENGKTLVTYGDWVYERISGDRYWEIDSYIGQDTELAIPRIVNDVMVVSLSDYCFNGNTAITSVETSSPLWNIGEYAFSGCTNLEIVELNFALQTIGVGAFSSTTSLKNINMEDSVVTEIKAHTFMNSGIEEVTLPETCEKIGNRAFDQCASLTKITIPSSVTEINDTAFDGCDDLLIFATKDSYAIEYAIENQIDYLSEYICGDSDRDGVISILDATTIQRRLASFELPVKKAYLNTAGDADVDGALTILDATDIQRYLAQYSVNPELGQTVEL